MPAGGLVIGGLVAAGQLGLSAYQANRASKLKLQDTTTPEQREMLAIARQRAASGRMPGMGLAQARLAQVQNATLQNAMLGAGSASDLLAAGAAADRTRQNGELQLGVQSDQYNERVQGQLSQQLGLQAQQRQRDLAAFNSEKSALIGGAIQNAGNAVNSGAAYAAYGLNKRADAAAGSTATATPGIQGAGLPGYLPASDHTPGLGLRSGYYGGSRTRSRYPGLY